MSHTHNGLSMLRFIKNRCFPKQTSIVETSMYIAHHLIDFSFRGIGYTSCFILSVELFLTFYFNYIFQLKNMEDIFPVEIWMHIFKWIDTSKLMELRLVSRFFFNLIECIFNKSRKWKELAQSTIMPDFLNLTMQRAYPYYLGICNSNIDDPILWRGTYLSYKKWQKVLGKEHEKDFIAPMSSCGRITCISTFDKYISIGLDNGFIENYSTDDLKTPFYIVNCNIYVKQTAFWYTNDQVLVVIVRKDNALKFLDLQNKVEISTPGFFANCIR
ncbi:hypothetical protein KQX54_002844 [Cotesia glomerata]|uniref:F-box domain-containing protein n=1 Tax=Cotesia glomerata TaxID=32391 RepID=A0AAV7J1E9_COTGL|nr:hypothetical protein KQX54_002844 [Cotesia glomerata]